MNIKELLEEYETINDYVHLKRGLLLYQTRVEEILGVSKCILCNNTGELQQPSDALPPINCAFCETKKDLI